MSLAELMTNKDTPLPQMRCTDYPGIHGTVYEYRHMFYAAKHAGKYKLKDRYYVSINKLDSSHRVNKKLLEDTKTFIKQGRYHDYFFVNEPYSEGQV